MDDTKPTDPVSAALVPPPPAEAPPPELTAEELDKVSGGYAHGL